MAGRILLIEDRPWQRESLQKQFTSRGFDCQVAEDFKDARRVIAQEDFFPDIMILDLIIEGSEPYYRFVRKVKKAYPDILIVILSAWYISSLDEQLMAEGVIERWFEKSTASEQIEEMMQFFRKRLRKR